MAINVVTAYQEAILARFALGSLTNSTMAAQYSWVSASTVQVLTNDLATMGDYTRSGTNRFGVPTELGNTKQDLTLARDRAFTYTIDKRGAADRGFTIDAGSSLARNIQWVVVPEVDKYRIAAIATACTSGNLVTTSLTLSASTAYPAFLTATQALDEGLVPQGGRVAFVAPAILTVLKQDPNFIRSSELGQQVIFNGQIGEIDGVAIIKTPSTYLPSLTDFVMFHPAAVAAPLALADYRQHVDPPGISGVLVEGRWVYDAFVLNGLATAIAVHKHA